GLYYGLIIFLIYNVRIQSFWGAYGYYLDVIGFIFSYFFAWVAYGLMLGVLYESLLEKYTIPKVRKKIITYSMISGIIPGAIAGLADGFAASIANFIAFAIGIFKLPGAPTTLTFEFWIGQSGAHLFMNLVWGAVFGAIFARVYNLLPSKGIMKGLYYSLIIVSITSFFAGFFTIGWGLSYSFWPAIYTSLWNFFIAFLSTGVALGLVLGYLYKPPK
ncbi:MAG: hypothetical protein NWF08_05900, partial [Candidatus Bathyarchaeota archaeon]|nr:hypothetical protein [Candidatus Bathyarchaeota archaeon]